MIDPQLGRLVPEDAQRDAIHMAIIPVIAGEPLTPGDCLKLAYGTTNVVLDATYYGKPEEIIGIADPFLRLRPDTEVHSYGPGDYESEQPHRIRKGDRFYMLLKPGTVTGMRHHWSHPVFDQVKPAVNEHEDWLRRFAEKWGFHYDEIVSMATSPTDGEWDNYICARGKDLHSADELDPGELESFWEHIEGLTGSKYEPEHREKVGWTCSC